MTSKKKTIIHILFVFFYTIIIVSFTLGIYYLVKRKDYNNYNKRIMETNSYYQKQQIETLNVIAYGPERGGRDTSIKLIQLLNTPLLSEKDKETLRENFKYSENNYNYYKHLIVYFGIKDDIDYIYIYNPEKEKDEPKELLFKSNLAYTFNSVVLDFKNEYGIVLSNEFLQSVEYDSANHLLSGIIIYFVENGNNNYNISYLVKYDGKAYVINK